MGIIASREPIGTQEHWLSEMPPLICDPSTLAGISPIVPEKPPLTRGAGEKAIPSPVLRRDRKGDPILGLFGDEHTRVIYAMCPAVLSRLMDTFLVRDDVDG